MNTAEQQQITRRNFLTRSLAVAASATLVKPVLSRADESSAPVISTSEETKAFPVTRKIKLGLIGCGKRGHWLGGLFKEHGGFDIVATADYFQTEADKSGDAYGVDKARRFSGLQAYQRLLDSGVEAVTVVNIPRFHAEHGHAAAEAGCHVYAAKPVAIDAPRALKVLDAGKLATQKKLVYLVDYQMPTDPVNSEVVKRIHAGGLGKLMYMDSYGFSGVWPDPGNRKAETLLHSGNWLTTIPLSGDFIVEYSIHSLDAAVWVAGQRPVLAMGRTRRCRQNAHGDGRDLYKVTYEFEDGLARVHHCQALRNGAAEGLSCKVAGDSANAQLSYSGKSFLQGGPKHFGGGQVVSLYNEGAKRNIADFYRNIIEGHCANPTVPRAVDGALAGILGREAAARRKELTMAELIQENAELPFDLTGCKA